MNIDLKNKKVVLIAPKYFGYEDFIQKKLESMGATVYLIYEDMDEISYIYRFVNAYFPQRMPSLMNRYYLKNILPLAPTLDFVIAIRAQFLNLECLEKIKKSTKAECKFIMYQWDSVKNNPNALNISFNFDKVSTFDPVDAKRYEWNYRPLFYIPELVCNNSILHDVMYVCSLHSKRMEILQKLKCICRDNNLKLYSRVYFRRLVYYKRKYISKRPEYQNYNDGDINSRKMSIKDTYNLYNSSSIIVDYTHPGQSGFTMRTIESVGCKCKLITNNPNIKEADFYDENNIFVYQGDNLFIPKDFMTCDYKELSNDVYDKYSISRWIEDVIS